MSDAFQKIRDENKVGQGDLESIIKGGAFTHVGLMKCDTKTGASALYLMAYDFDKNQVLIDPVFTPDEARKGLDDCASKYDLINERLLVDENFDPISLAVEKKLYKSKLGGLDDLKYDYDFANNLKEIENSFAVERDIRFGLMLAPDKQKLRDIMKMRKESLDEVRERGGIDNMLAYEKVFVDGGKNPIDINYVRTIIGGLRDIREDDGKEYKAKVEEAQANGLWKAGVDDLPKDDCAHDLVAHTLGLKENVLLVLNADVQKMVEPDLQLRSYKISIACVRHEMMKMVKSHYKDLQREALQPEKEIAKTKAAGAEIGM